MFLTSAVAMDGERGSGAGREEVEYVNHAGLRAQKTAPRGERPGLPPEPGPQRSDRTPRRSQMPLPVASKLPRSSFLTARALDDRRKEEEEVALKKKEQLIAKRREASLELDKLLHVPFKRRTAREDERTTELHALLARLDRERAALFTPSVKRKKKKRKMKRTRRTCLLRF